ncbi:MAG: glycosyltransferase [Armatimonadota bacterium]
MPPLEVLCQWALFAWLAGVAALVWLNHRDYRVPAREEARRDLPLVSILVPVRNEAENVEACLQGLQAQDYPRLEIRVLDDGSTDDTAARVLRVASGDPRVRLHAGCPLPPGWGGKTHACHQLAQLARGEWLLFVDADTRHHPELVSRAVAEARRQEADLLTGFPRQEIGSLGEALTVPFVYWLVFTLLPIRLVRRSPQPALAAGCGQLLLARREAYFQTGGHGAIPASLHDGLHLARRFKQAGKAVALADLSPLISCRMYRGWRECWHGFGRNAYQGIGSLPALLTLTTLEVLLFLFPPLSLLAALAGGWPAWAWPVLGQVLLLGAIHAGLRRRFRYPWSTVLLHPLGIAASLTIQWSSYFRTRRGGSVAWKGRKVVSAAGVGSGGPGASEEGRRLR